MVHISPGSSKKLLMILFFNIRTELKQFNSDMRMDY